MKHIVRTACGRRSTRPLGIPCVTLISALTLSAPLSATEIRIPSLETATIGASTEEAFAFESTALARIAFSGGAKFGGRVELGISSASIESSFRSGAVMPLSVGLLSFTAYRLGNAPVDITWFLGTGDSFCNGDSFASWFDDPPAGTSYRGIQYFPEGINGDSSVQFDGIHRVNGTGLSLAMRHSKTMLSALYLYHDIDFAKAENVLDGEEGTAGDLVMNEGYWSGDLRFLINTDTIKFEAFAGASFPSGSAGTWRGGLLTFLSTGTGADFLLQTGIPRWDSDTPIGIDNFYFLFEPRIAMGPTSLHITLFYHPFWYRQEETGDQAQTDLNLRFTIGNFIRSRMEGGLETTIYFRGRNNGEGPIGVSINPFYSFLQSGVRWDLKAMMDPFEFDRLQYLCRLYVGVRTAF